MDVTWADTTTVVLRQPLGEHFEAPFLYLLMGSERAILFDSGATPDNDLRETIDGLIGERQLILGHSHAHSDHTAGDLQFMDPSKPDVAHRGYEPGDIELGGRTLTVLATPGHHPTAITVFDPQTGWLLTGDTVYPGRLYVNDMSAFIASLRELTAINGVTAVMGCHIELSASGHEYPEGATEHPDEAALALPPGVLEAVLDAAILVQGRVGSHPFPGFIIVNAPE
jgi:hydroxyacylglutathione hydrolase